jgi:hypothetical protein
MSEETIYKAQEKIKLNAETSPAPWILIGAGTVLLLASIFDLHLMDYLWPGFILLPGLLMMVPAYKSTAVDQSRWSFLAVPVMNIFDHFEAWAYCWPMIPAAVAAGVLYMTRFDDNKSLEQRAHKFIRFMVMMLVGLAFFFEIIVFENFNPLMSIGLILFGLYLLRQDRRSVKSAV